MKRRREPRDREPHQPRPAAPELATLDQALALVARGMHAMFAMKLTRDEARAWLDRPAGDPPGDDRCGDDMPGPAPLDATPPSRSQSNGPDHPSPKASP